MNRRAAVVLGVDIGGALMVIPAGPLVLAVAAAGNAWYEGRPR